MSAPYSFLDWLARVLSIVMTAEKKKKWKKFEEIVAEIQRELSPQAEVTTNQLLPG
jgi:hypothetical protein